MCAGIVNSFAQGILNIESGAVFTGYNKVRIPGNTGTRFSLNNDLKGQTEGFIRLKGNYTLAQKHTFLLLYAPLKTDYSGKFENEIVFAGKTFQPQTDINGEYKFNSYRLTYRYNLILQPRVEFGIGFTAKIRDASIRLSSPGLQAEKTNVGFVPIIHIRLAWAFAENTRILLEGDALAAKQGRAEDFLLALQYQLSDQFAIHSGYRILEGGSDGSSVYNFALFHYAAIGASWKVF